MLHGGDLGIAFLSALTAALLKHTSSCCSCRRFGTWMVGKLVESRNGVIFDGPICNGSEVIGWHSHRVPLKNRRFHAEMSGFAFNSTILWDPKRWHQPTLEPIRLIHTLNKDFHVCFSSIPWVFIHCGKQGNYENLQVFIPLITSWIAGELIH